MKLRRFATVATLLTVVLCVSTFESASGKVNQPKEPYVFGFAMAFTGFLSGSDVPTFNGARIAIRDINARGGVFGRRFTYVKADSGTDISRGSAAALKVLERGANVVITTNDYNYGGPGARVAEKRGVISLQAAGDPLAGRQGIGPLHFSVFTSTNSESAAMAVLGRRKGWKRAYLLTDTSIDYSKRGCSYFAYSWKRLGGTITGESTFKQSDPSISSQVSSIRAASGSADVIVVCSYLPAVTSVVRQIRSGGVNLPILSNLGGDARYMADGIPDLSDFFYVNFGRISGGDPNPNLTKLGQKYKKFLGNLNAQDFAPIMGYAEVMVIVRAMQATKGSTDPKTLAAAIERFRNEDLVVTRLTYSKKCHTPQRTIYRALEAQNGRVRDIGGVVPKAVAPAPC